jgi:hypothetical protein
MVMNGVGVAEAPPQRSAEASPAEAMRVGEADKAWLQEHLEVLEPHRGEWVVIYKQQIIAHSRDGRVAARTGNARTYPGALLLYVPTAEEVRAVHIL